MKRVTKLYGRLRFPPPLTDIHIYSMPCIDQISRWKEDIVPVKHHKYIQALILPSASLKIRVLTLAGALAALAVALLALGWSGSAWAQGQSTCDVIDLGTLSADADSELTGTGRWTTNDCNSRFRTGSDAHSYRFEVVEGGRIRIDLGSTDGDSFLYLLTEDGRRLTDNDDGGAGLDARIERDLTPGIYVVEATTVGGRSRGPANFTLSISRAAGCDPVHLGTLRTGIDLTTSGSWSLDTCGSRFVVEHPAHSYLFTLNQAARVRVDLMSENGDPVLSLVSPTDGLIAANDDGGESRNSRINRYLAPGTYLLEATTYLERDYQPLMADFTLVVHLVDEEADQASFLLKIEDVQTPNQVVAGQPFDIHYRVGNLGGGDLADINGNARVYVVGPRPLFDITGRIDTSEGSWASGVSYHTGAQTASETSVELGEIAPFEGTLRSPGPSWIFVGVVTDDEDENERGFHGQWHNLMVLSSTTFDAITVGVDGTDYRVEANADADGMVTTTVSAVNNPDADVDPLVRAKAIYTAGVRTQVVEEIFERPAIADLPITGASTPTDVENPSSTALLEKFTDRYTTAITLSGLPSVLAAKEVLNPATIEDLVLRLSRSASIEYVSLAASWSALQDRINEGETLSSEDALALYSELVYAERVISPAVAAGRAVEEARAAALGWEDAGVQEMLDDLALQASCRDPGRGLREVLEEMETTDLDEMLKLDAEMRAALPAYGFARDAVLCAVAGADRHNTLFLESLAIADNSDIRELLGYEQPTATTVAPPPYRLRIIAMLDEEGRIEHGVELAGGEQILPSRRHLSSEAPPGIWQISSDVEVDGNPIGRVRSRRLDDGRVEFGFMDAVGETITPEIRYLSEDIPAGVWLRSAEIEVTREPILE